MITEETQLTWLDNGLDNGLDNHDTFSFDELIALSGLPKATLIFLVENQALMPTHTNQTADNILNVNTWYFSSHHLVTVRKLSRLQHVFELEDNSLGLILLYLERIRTLEAQLQHLEKQHDY